MKVFVVLCRIDQETEFSCIYETEKGARAYCQQENTKSSYYGRYTFHSVEVRRDADGLLKVTERTQM
jgi:hypothetical protein